MLPDLFFDYLMKLKNYIFSSVSELALFLVVESLPVIFVNFEIELLTRISFFQVLTASYRI